jgi:predicted O-methyltransferase YrrM
MSIPFGQDPGVKIDTAHSNLLIGLVQSNKPKTMLEIGIGGGQATDAMLSALEFNQQPFSYDIVDCWWDWHGVKPEGVDEKYGDKCNIITSYEKDFVFSTDKTYDFIMSDGDHHSTDQWFEHVFDKLLNPGGILVYHDVTLIDKPNIFPNLRNIYYKAKDLGLRFHLFDKDSRSDERCWRGILVIFKDDDYDTN